MEQTQRVLQQYEQALNTSDTAAALALYSS